MCRVKPLTCSVVGAVRGEAVLMVVVSGKLSTYHRCMALVRAEKSGGPSTGSNPGTGGAGIKAGVGCTGVGAQVAAVVPATSRQSWRRRTWSTWPRLAAWVWRAARSVASVVISMVISCGGCF